MKEKGEDSCQGRKRAGEGKHRVKMMNSEEDTKGAAEQGTELSAASERPREGFLGRHVGKQLLVMFIFLF